MQFLFFCFDFTYSSILTASQTTMDDWLLKEPAKKRRTCPPLSPAPRSPSPGGDSSGGGAETVVTTIPETPLSPVTTVNDADDDDVLESAQSKYHCIYSYIYSNCLCC